MKKGNLIIIIIVGFSIISIAMTGVGFVLLSGGGGDSDAGKIIEERTIESAVNLASVIAAASIDPLFMEDDFVINEMINKAVEASGGNIDYIYVLDDNKKVWGDTKNPTNVLKPFSDKSIELVKSENRKIQKINDRIFDAGVPIIAGKNKIGEVHLGMKYPDIPISSSSPEIMPFIIIFVIGIIGALGIAFAVSKVLSNVGAEFATSLKSAKLDELRKQEEDAQKSLTSKNMEVKESEKKLDEINMKIKELGSKYDDVQNTINKSDEIIADKKKQADYYEKRIEELAEKQKNMKDDAESSKMAGVSKQELVTLKSQVNNFKLQLQQTINEIENKRKEEKALTEKIKSLQTNAAKAGGAAGPVSSQDMEKKKREEIEITQRIVAKRKEEIAMSQRVELKRKKELELTGRIELMEKKLKEMGN